MDVVAVLDHVGTTDEHVPHQRIAAGEDPGVERRILGPACQQRVVGIEHGDVEAVAGGDRANGLTHRARPTLQRGVIKGASGGPARPARQRIAGQVAQALGIFEHAQVFGGRDGDVAVGADGDGPALRHELHRRENAVAQIGLGRRA